MIPRSRLQAARSKRIRRVGAFQTAALTFVGVLHAPLLVLAQTAPSPPGNATPAPADVSSSSPSNSENTATPAPSKREQARAAYFAGKSAFSAGNFSEAEAQFALANSLIPAVQALYWYALSLDGQDKTQMTLQAFANVLSHPSRGKLRSEQLERARTRLEQLKTAPADVLLGTNPAGAQIFVNGQPIGTLTPTPLRLGPGQHEVTVEREGYVTQRFLLTADPGAKLNPVIELTPTVPVATLPTVAPLSAPAPLSPPSLHDRAQPSNIVPAAVTLGLAGVSGVIGGIFGVKALSRKKSFNDSPTAKRADDTERNALIADMAFGVTLTLGITGAVLLLTHEDSGSRTATTNSTSTAKLHFAPFVSIDSAGAAAVLEF